MKSKIMITNVYYCNRDGKNYTRLNYIIVGKDKYNDSDVFKGFSEIASFYNGDSVFNLITKDLIGCTIEGNFSEKHVRGKGLTTSWILSSIDVNGTSIDLL